MIRLERCFVHGQAGVPLLELSGKWQQRDVARALDRFAEPALVTRTCAGHAARQNLAPLLNERLKHLGFLVIDEVHALDAESANFLLAEILALAAASRTPRSATWSSGTAAFASLPSASAAGKSFTARPTTAGMSFGTVATAATAGCSFRARSARSMSGGWRFW